MPWKQTQSQSRHFERRWAINLRGELLEIDDLENGYVFAEANATLDLDTVASLRLDVWIHDERRAVDPPRASAVLPGKVDPHLDPVHLLRIAEACAAHLARAYALIEAVNAGDDLAKIG